MGLTINPYKESDKGIGFEEITTVLSMKGSGKDLYLFLLEHKEKYFAHDGIAYLNPSELTHYTDSSRKTVYNGINSMIQANILRRTTVPGEYFYNWNFFPKN